MIITQPLEITTPDGRGTGRWRLVEMSDEHDGAEPLCNCGGLASDNPTTCGHESPEAARECPIAAAKVAHLQPARPTVAELARASGLFGLLAVLALGDAVDDLRAAVTAHATREESEIAAIGGRLSVLLPAAPTTGEQPRASIVPDMPRLPSPSALRPVTPPPPRRQS